MRFCISELRRIVHGMEQKALLQAPHSQRTLWEMSFPAATRKGYFPCDATWHPDAMMPAGLDDGINPVATHLGLNANAESRAGPDILALRLLARFD
jgi:hypothetical protein